MKKYIFLLSLLSLAATVTLQARAKSEFTFTVYNKSSKDCALEIKTAHHESLFWGGFRHKDSRDIVVRSHNEYKYSEKIKDFNPGLQTLRVTNLTDAKDSTTLNYNPNTYFCPQSVEITENDRGNLVVKVNPKKRR